MKLIWIKWFPSDWLSDEALRGCSVEARGLWVDMISLMAKSEKEGYLLAGKTAINANQLSRIAGIDFDKCEQLLSELGSHGVYSIDDGVIFSRRMVKDSKLRKSNRDRVLRFRNAGVTQKKQPCNENVMPQRSEVRDQRSEKEREGLRPTLTEWIAFAKEIGWRQADAESAFDYYQSNGWKVGGKASVKDWRACARNCQRRSNQPKGNNQVIKQPHRSQCESLPTWKLMKFATREAWVEAGCP